MHFSNTAKSYYNILQFCEVRELEDLVCKTGKYIMLEMYYPLEISWTHILQSVSIKFYSILKPLG